MTWLAVAAGGAMGSVARHGVNLLVQARWPLLRFPLATLAVNVIGCFVIGLLAGLIAADKLHLRFAWREFIFIGVLGGFTTFSSFGLDTLLLARSGAPAHAILNVVLQVGIGLGAGLSAGMRRVPAPEPPDPPLQFGLATVPEHPLSTELGSF